MRGSLWAVPLCGGSDRWLTVYYSLIIYRWRGRAGERELPIFSLNRGWTDCADWLQSRVWHRSPVHPSQPLQPFSLHPTPSGFGKWNALFPLTHPSWRIRRFMLQYMLSTWYCSIVNIGKGVNKFIIKLNFNVNFRIWGTCRYYRFIFYIQNMMQNLPNNTNVGISSNQLH